MWTTVAPLSVWSARRWLVAALAGTATAVLVALPTAVIPNPVFGRTIEVTWWSYPVVIVTGVLGGLLVATYVREAAAGPEISRPDEPDRPLTLATAGGLVSFFAVGCPVCNKVVLLALGASGAVTWFAPVQPFLALASIALMVWALRLRLRGATQCDTPSPSAGGRAQ